MNRVHTAFFAAGDGASLRAIIEKPIHRYGYLLFSHQGLPAIAAVAWEIDPLLAKIPAARRTHAIQACGALIGDILEAHGAERALTAEGVPVRRRVRNSSTIRSGSVWELASDRQLVLMAGEFG